MSGLRVGIWLASSVLAVAYQCPLLADVPPDVQRVIVPCGRVRAQGVCDSTLQCNARFPALNATSLACSSKLPCTAAGEACLCTDAFVCHRRVTKQRTAVLLCINERDHAKRQEAHHADDDDSDSDTSSFQRGGTLSFLGVLLLVYCAIGCLVAIYVRPPP